MTKSPFAFSSQVPSVSDSSTSTTSQNQPIWTIEDSEKLYNVKGWGEPYFAINQAGNITVSASQELSEISLDLYELVTSLRQQNIGLPLLIRFSDILADRIKRLSACMNNAIARYDYQGSYQTVFPIKCNQNRHLVRDLVRYGAPYSLGLEVGSKPELIIALAALEPSDTNSQRLLICNGYKDRDYIETALLATRLGQKVIIVIEQLKEFYLALEVGQKLGIKPSLGVRAKLNTKGTGRWGNSTGDRAKFGLTIPKIVAVVTELSQHNLLDCLQLLHFHIGSQISSIAVIKNAIREASQIYVQLAKMGANMQYLDVGGGLAVDYDGSKTNSSASKNYNMQNYANDIVVQVKDACNIGSVKPPIIISESGRAIASHQSVLVFEALGTNELPRACPVPPTPEEPLVIKNFWETYQSISDRNDQEAYHDAIELKEEALSLFTLGYLSLAERSRAEEIYWACCCKIASLITGQEYVPDELQDLEKMMTSIYYVNLSIFRSAPDTWAIDQLFPIMPIHRLNEEPTARGILADLTCDSDGTIDSFIDLREDIKDVLELHRMIPLENSENSQEDSQINTEPYYLGMFLVGAYQEIMGSLHNLFGDTNVVHIAITPEGYQVKEIINGNTVQEVLRAVKYEGDELLKIMRSRTEIALKNNNITPEEAEQLLQHYQEELSSYTYLVNH